MHKGFYVHSIKFPDNPLEFRIKFKFNQDDLKNDGVESLWYDTSAKDEITIKSKGGTVEEIFKNLSFLYWIQGIYTDASNYSVGSNFDSDPVPGDTYLMNYTDLIIECINYKTKDIVKSAPKVIVRRNKMINIDKLGIDTSDANQVQDFFNNITKQAPDESAVYEFVFDVNFEMIYCGFLDAAQESKWDNKKLSEIWYILTSDADSKVYFVEIEYEPSDFKLDTEAYTHERRRVINIFQLEPDDKKVLYYIASMMEIYCVEELEEIEESVPWLAKIIKNLGSTALFDECLVYYDNIGEEDLWRKIFNDSNA